MICTVILHVYSCGLILMRCIRTCVFTQTGCYNYEYHYINLITKPTIGQ